ncbi:Nuf2 family-domain-containing protein [Dunaliella salina]|uniref:Nuf2 family-domain-containing protein n=1 Tax=Dunaliella salina TaxID=3046 RepID=A0ABQ7G905_DUNSA|nr:Nuf2 family-domain-containing protein [Dunaliella salina]|eukprot:KAF5831089.1 Nuf2 family-domain-containing protein [Dunaliella salina]
MSQSSFSFPILENDELLPCLSEMEVALDANQLAKPSYEVVRCVFEQIVIMLTGVTREELTQPVFTAMDAFEYPELHDESIPTNNFFRLLLKLMVASGVKDFSWRDVFKPDPLKLRRNLSAIINFAKFREEKALAFQELQGQLDGMVDSTRALEEEYAKNMSELQAMQAHRSEQAAEVSQVEAEEAEITARNTQLNKHAAGLQNEVRQLKAHANSLADVASQAKLDLAAAKQETATLSDQIVQSPEKHRQAIAELAAVGDAKRTYCAQLSSQLMDNDRKLEMVVKVRLHFNIILAAHAEGS